MEHTKGPWGYDGNVDGSFDVMSDGVPELTFVAETYTEQDARLIAAAPDLLNALKIMMKWALRTVAKGNEKNENLPALWEEFKSAIEKAGGGD